MFFGIFNLTKPIDVGEIRDYNTLKIDIWIKFNGYMLAFQMVLTYYSDVVIIIVCQMRH